MERGLVSLKEVYRLEDLRSYNILDTPAEEDFDDLVDLAALLCNCATALITFVDKDRQWFKARIQMEAEQTSRDISFCSQAIQQNDVFIVENAFLDQRFANNPLVTGGIHIRFYAGAPIFSTAGNKLGTICVIDKKPKILLPKQVEALKKLSSQATRLLELRMKNQLLKQFLDAPSAA